ncbi:MAG TPA: PilZ domain-containing protein [Mycobacteriales bacterium]|nr:PilZ domain-containing protein [Mycobacteriales bacterium]
MVVVPAGSILQLRTGDLDSVELLNLVAVPITRDAVFDVLVLSEVGEVEEGIIELPTRAGLFRLPARLKREESQVVLTSGEPLDPLQRRRAPRSGLVLPLRGAAQIRGENGDLAEPGGLITFHGHTVDVAPGGLQARLVSDVGLRLPPNLQSIFVELDPGNPQSVAVGLTVVAFRSDVLRARFSFISLADWARLRERSRDQS